MTRAIPDWVSGFEDYTTGLSSPLIFRRWSAITAIAGAIEQKMWVRSQGSNLYPNIYTILVAPPGVGKSVSTKRIEVLWRGLKGQHVAGNSLSKAALIDELVDASREVIIPTEKPAAVSFNSTKLLVNELGTLFPQYDMEFMATLTDIYDGTPYNERKRSQKLEIKIDRPQFTILGATTPSHLNAFLPEGAWDQGFLSRTFLIYSGDRRITPLFEDRADDKELGRQLQRDLSSIGNMAGQMVFDDDAAAAITAWHMGDNPPKPDHPKLQHYNSRRTLHLLKLCMVSSAAVSTKKVITLEHYERALRWLLEAEAAMPEIFKAMRSGGDAKAIEECHYYAKSQYVSTGQPVPEGKLILFLQERVPAHNIERILEVMSRAGILQTKIVARVGKCYIPYMEA
jgi:hypothetical protein